MNYDKLKQQQYFYKVYGLTVKSELKIPELISIKEDDLSKIDINIIFKDIPKDVERLNSGSSGYIFKDNEVIYTIKNIASFYIISGEKIFIEKNKEANYEDIKDYLLGNVFSILLIQRGILALHGGCVVKKDRAVLVSGESGAGKSTLIAALLSKGYKFLTDDLSVIDIDKSMIPRVQPSYPQQNLCEDIMNTFKYKKHDYIKIKDEIGKYKIPLDKYFFDKAIDLNVMVQLEIADIEEILTTEVKGKEKMDIIFKNIYKNKFLGQLNADRKYFENYMHFVRNTKVYLIKRPKGKICIKEEVGAIENIINKI